MNQRKISSLQDNQKRYALIQELTQLYKAHGYTQISIPIYESEYNTPTVNQHNAVRFVDPVKGILTLQNDPTTALMKMLQQEQLSAVNKFCYYASTFGYQANTLQEMTQIGLEYYGISDAASDAEIVVLAIKSLLRINKRVLVEASDLRFYKAVERIIKENVDDYEKILFLISTKNIPAIKMAGLSEDLTTFLIDFLSCSGKSNVVIANAKKLIESNFITDKTILIDAIKHLEEISSIIEAYDLSDYLLLDLTIYNAFKYYNGLIFKGYIKSCPTEICSGGRYDLLSSNFGSTVPACGFAISIDQILKTMEVKPMYKTNAIMICEPKISEEGIQLAELYRSQGFTVDIRVYQSEKAAIDLAQSQAIENIILLKNETAKLINLRKDEVLKYPVDEFKSKVNVTFKSESIH